MLDGRRIIERDVVGWSGADGELLSCGTLQGVGVFAGTTRMVVVVYLVVA